jgi:3-methyladenine DNA glycosylase Tag
MTNSLRSSDLDTAPRTSTHHTVTDDRSLRDDAAYLSLLSRKIFHAGFSQKAVDVGRHLRPLFIVSIQ